MESLRDRITRHEGVRLKPYRCTAGKLTLGIGRNLDDRGITLEEAQHLLDNDITACAKQVDLNLPWAATSPPIIREVLIEMAFQLGIAGLLQFKMTLSALQRRDYPAAADLMLDSKWAKQTPARAKELATLIESAA